MSRVSTIVRNTKETKINLTLNLDGTGIFDITSKIPFFDHMLDGFSRHGFFDLTGEILGDLEVDCHHTIEDTGIVLGLAMKEAMGTKKGMKRYGSSIIPMDETLALCAIDLCGRPYFNMEAEFNVANVGGMDTEMVREFFYAISYSCGMNLHIKILNGTNSHHMIEAIFKAFAKALDEATSYDARIVDVLSTKGSL